MRRRGFLQAIVSAGAVATSGVAGAAVVTPKAVLREQLRDGQRPPTLSYLDFSRIIYNAVFDGWCYSAQDRWLFAYENTLYPTRNTVYSIQFPGLEMCDSLAVNKTWFRNAPCLVWSGGRQNYAFRSITDMRKLTMEEFVGEI